ncbi:MAG TPA: SUMF1/EgtB/PvdO family nonheme iron enzyme, partial [Pirellulaceae bacterium]|nr:SUMF1/EgtB/PvdO family nonheme iron enzyme [Pirellulaceae bacterium]
MLAFAIRFRLRAAAIALAFASLLPAARAEEIKNSAGMTLTLIEAGRYERGERDMGRDFAKDHVEFNTAEDDRPVHPVVLTKPFYLATTEVTIAQFRQFARAAGYKTTAENNPRGAVGWDPTPPA